MSRLYNILEQYPKSIAFLRSKGYTIMFTPLKEVFYINNQKDPRRKLIYSDLDQMERELSDKSNIDLKKVDLEINDILL